MTPITAEELRSPGLTEAEIQDVLRSPMPEDLVRRLRRARGRLLSEIHSMQQALDRLDYLIFRVQNEA